MLAPRVNRIPENIRSLLAGFVQPQDKYCADGL